MAESIASQLLDTNTKVRLSTIQQLHLLLASTKPPLENLHFIVNPLIQIIDDNNSKISVSALECILSLINSNFELIFPKIQELFQGLLSVCGSNKDYVRENAVNIVVLLGNKVANIGDFIHALAESKNQKCRESAVESVSKLCQNYLSTSSNESLLDMEHLVVSSLIIMFSLMSDQSSQVRQAAQHCILTDIFESYSLLKSRSGCVDAKSVVCQWLSSQVRINSTTTTSAREPLLRPSHEAILMQGLALKTDLKLVTDDDDDDHVSSSSSSSSSKVTCPSPTKISPVNALSSSLNWLKDGECIPFVEVNSSSELNDGLNRACRLINNKNDWTRRMEGLLLLHGISRSSRSELYDLFLVQLKELSLIDLLSGQILERRSSLCREACRTVSSLFIHVIGDYMDRTRSCHVFQSACDVLLPLLIKVAGISINIMSFSAYSCLRFIIQSSRSGCLRIVSSSLSTHWVSCKTCSNRKCLLDVIIWMLMYWDWTNISPDQARSHASIIADCVVAGIIDADDATRCSTKLVYGQMLRVFGSGMCDGLVLDKLDVGMRRRLLSSLSSSDTSNYENDLTMMMMNGLKNHLCPATATTVIRSSSVSTPTKSAVDENLSPNELNNHDDDDDKKKVATTAVSVQPMPLIQPDHHRVVNQAIRLKQPSSQSSSSQPKRLQVVPSSLPIEPAVIVAVHAPVLQPVIPVNPPMMMKVNSNEIDFELAYGVKLSLSPPSSSTDLMVPRLSDFQLANWVSDLVSSSSSWTDRINAIKLMRRLLTICHQLLHMNGDGDVKLAEFKRCMDVDDGFLKAVLMIVSVRLFPILSSCQSLLSPAIMTLLTSNNRTTTRDARTDDHVCDVEANPKVRACLLDILAWMMSHFQPTITSILTHNQAMSSNLLLSLVLRSSNLSETGCEMNRGTSLERDKCHVIVDCVKGYGISGSIVCSLSLHLSSSCKNKQSILVQTCLCEFLSQLLPSSLPDVLQPMPNTAHSYFDSLMKKMCVSSLESMPNLNHVIKDLVVTLSSYLSSSSCAASLSSSMSSIWSQLNEEKCDIGTNILHRDDFIRLILESMPSNLIDCIRRTLDTSNHSIRSKNDVSSIPLSVFSIPFIKTLESLFRLCNYQYLRNLCSVGSGLSSEQACVCLLVCCKVLISASTTSSQVNPTTMLMQPIDVKVNDHQCSDPKGLLSALSSNDERMFQLAVRSIIQHVSSTESSSVMDSDRYFSQIAANLFEKLSSSLLLLERGAATDTNTFNAALIGLNALCRHRSRQMSVLFLDMTISRMLLIIDNGFIQTNEIVNSTHRETILSIAEDSIIGLVSSSPDTSTSVLASALLLHSSSGSSSESFHSTTVLIRSLVVCIQRSNLTEVTNIIIPSAVHCITSLLSNSKSLVIRKACIMCLVEMCVVGGAGVMQGYLNDLGDAQRKLFTLYINKRSGISQLL